MTKDETCFGGQQCTHCECGHRWRSHDFSRGYACACAGCGCQKFKEKHPAPEPKK